MKIRTFLFFFISLCLLVACGGNQSLEEPPEIMYGEDVCEECSMIINEPRFSASYVLTDGTVRRFDGIGEMIIYDTKYAEDVHIYWVHDYKSEEWITTKDATFLLSSDAHTPMGWGMLAFAQKADAEQFLAENEGVMMTWDDLNTAVASGELSPGTLSAHLQSHSGMNHGDEMNHEGMDH